MGTWQILVGGTGSPKVLATFQWAAYLTDEAYAEGKVPLRINIDESPIPLAHKSAKGNIVRCGTRRNKHREPRRELKRPDYRTHFTHVAFICDQRDIQPLLPQILVVPERALPITEWRIIARELPENVFFAPAKIHVGEFQITRSISEATPKNLEVL